MILASELSGPEATVINSVLVTVGVFITGYFGYLGIQKEVRKRRGRNEDVSDSNEAVNSVKAMGVEALSQIATESLTYLQRMLEQSQKNEKDLRATVQELERTNQQKDGLINRLRSQLEEQITLNEETARELTKLRRRLNERQGE